MDLSHYHRDGVVWRQRCISFVLPTRSDRTDITVPFWELVSFTARQPLRWLKPLDASIREMKLYWSLWGNWIIAAAKRGIRRRMGSRLVESEHTKRIESKQRNSRNHTNKHIYFKDYKWIVLIGNMDWTRVVQVTVSVVIWKCSRCQDP